MKTSQSGRAATERREGRKLVAYRDTEGILTIGVGHTGRMSPPAVTPGMTITEAQCDALLAADLAPVENVINMAVKVPISQNEFDALASLGFNIGASGLRTSTVIRKLNLGDVQGAADAFLLWAKPAVLLARREDEKKQFLTPDTAIAAARAQTLSAKAAASQAKARKAGSGGGAMAVTGIAATAAVAQSGHHTVAWVIAAVVLAGVAIDIAAIVAHRRKAVVLATNAVLQASPSAPTVPAATLAQPVALKV